jgi:uncharacterized protein
MIGLSIPLVVLLGLFGLIGGIGITALGPGGVLPTIGLFALTGLSPARVAGTAIVTHVATGAVATAAYTRSGQLRQPHIRRTALLLAGAAVVGAPLGVLVNTRMSKPVFGLVLGVFVAVVAVLMWCRERHNSRPLRPHPSTVIVVSIGLAVAAAAGIVGIGGPMLTVPLLITFGVPVLESLAASQVQSIVIAGVGTLGYLPQGAIDWPLAVLVGVPELTGVLLGWKIARLVPSRTLKYALIITLLGLAPYLALHG